MHCTVLTSLTDTLARLLSVGWPTCCPPDGNKAALVHALEQYYQQTPSSSPAPVPSPPPTPPHPQSGSASGSRPPASNVTQPGPSRLPSAHRCNLREWFQREISPTDSLLLGKTAHNRGQQIDVRAQIITSFNGTPKTNADKERYGGVTFYRNSKDIIVNIRQAFPEFHVPGTNSTESRGDHPYQGFAWLDRERIGEQLAKTHLTDPITDEPVKEWKFAWLTAASNAKVAICFVNSKFGESRNTLWEHEMLHAAFGEEDVAYVSVERDENVEEQHLLGRQHYFNFAAMGGETQEMKVIAELCAWIGTRIGIQPTFPKTGKWKSLPKSYKPSMQTSSCGGANGEAIHRMRISDNALCGQLTKAGTPCKNKAKTCRFH